MASEGYPHFDLVDVDWLLGTRMADVRVRVGLIQPRTQSQS
jgi:hypothetical protein